MRGGGRPESLRKEGYRAFVKTLFSYCSSAVIRQKEKDNSHTEENQTFFKARLRPAKKSSQRSEVSKIQRFFGQKNAVVLRMTLARHPEQREGFLTGRDSYLHRRRVRRVLRGRMPLGTVVRLLQDDFNERLAKKCAFTLAEVLITIGIIGVVAAMTLPALINNSRNKQLEAGLKRGYSLIGQALDTYQAETGERATPQNIKPLKLKPLLMKYLSTVRDCGWGSDIDKACIPVAFRPQDADKNSQVYKRYTNLNGIINLTVMDDGQFVLNDGSLVLLENGNGSNNLYISVDVNGFSKKPNQLGHDLFMFQIDNKGTLLPMGAKGTTYYSETDEYCSLTSYLSMNGAGCTYKALTENDYFKNLPK